MVYEPLGSVSPRPPAYALPNYLLSIYEYKFKRTSCPPVSVARAADEETHLNEETHPPSSRFSPIRVSSIGLVSVISWSRRLVSYSQSRRVAISASVSCGILLVVS